MILLLPWAVPAYITAIAWLFIFNGEYGLLNNILGVFGIPSVAWLSTFPWYYIMPIIVNVWLGIPFMMVVLLGGLQSIPGDLYEAAQVDGASADAAVLEHHPAAAQVGQHDGHPARLHLDVQHLRRHLLHHRRRTRRQDRHPRHLHVQRVHPRPVRDRGDLRGDRSSASCWCSAPSTAAWPESREETHDEDVAAPVAC